MPSKDRICVQKQEMVLHVLRTWCGRYFDQQSPCSMLLNSTSSSTPWSEIDRSHWLKMLRHLTKKQGIFLSCKYPFSIKCQDESKFLIQLNRNSTDRPSLKFLKRRNTSSAYYCDDVTKHLASYDFSMIVSHGAPPFRLVSGSGGQLPLPVTSERPLCHPRDCFADIFCK